MNLAAGVEITELDDGAIITDTNSGYYISLNVTAFKMTRALMQGKTEDAIVKEVVSEFSVEEHVCLADLRELVQNLAELNLVDS